MKKLLSSILALAMFCCLVPLSVSAESETTVNEKYYTIGDESQLYTPYELEEKGGFYIIETISGELKTVDSTEIVSYLDANPGDDVTANATVTVSKWSSTTNVAYLQVTGSLRIVKVEGNVFVCSNSSSPYYYVNTTKTFYNNLSGTSTSLLFNVGTFTLPSPNYLKVGFKDLTISMYDSNNKLQSLTRNDDRIIEI